jgi:hypothetical protein
LQKIFVCLATQGIELACDACGEDHPAVIDFHHTDPQVKEFSISVAVRKRYSMERITGEIKKCRQLCSNCHRKLHWGERGNQRADNGVQEATR